MGAAANLAGIATEHHLFNISALKSEKMESLGVLAGGLAHDFNNLLKAIVGNLSLAQLDTEVGSPQDRALRLAQQASDRVREVAGRLLTFSRGALQSHTLKRSLTCCVRRHPSSCTDPRRLFA